ncbi:FACT complex subunit SPT16 [Cyclospora cayetanensis]|uniref:FACT complex subunit n=1 Tax=Cyclospora cayetanensis TaxID=88456 RepID=A0A6P6RSL7_9EIME|nr:FACT complex subunit SPT16 [Cyclospora cayetanensis]
MALNYQKQRGMLPPTAEFNLFANATKRGRETRELYPQDIAKSIRFTNKSHPECAAFSPDGRYLASGSIDGFVEVWDWQLGGLNKDLQYQRESSADGVFAGGVVCMQNHMMMHETAVVAIAFSRDSEALATGSQTGQLKVWLVATGQCIKKIDKAHDAAIASICFSKDNTHLLTGSFDTTARIHGLKAGKTLKEFRGHLTFVNCAIYLPDNSRILTGSADGKVKLWDAKTQDCLSTFTPPIPPHMQAAQCLPSVMAVILAPRSLGMDLIYVCTKSNTISLMNYSGKAIKTWTSGKKHGGDFVAACISPRAEWILCAGEDHSLYCFANATGKLEHVMKVRNVRPQQREKARAPIASILALNPAGADTTPPPVASPLCASSGERRQALSSLVLLASDRCMQTTASLLHNNMEPKRELVEDGKEAPAALPPEASPQTATPAPASDALPRADDADIGSRLMETPPTSNQPNPAGATANSTPSSATEGQGGGPSATPELVKTENSMQEDEKKPSVSSAPPTEATILPAPSAAAAVKRDAQSAGQMTTPPEASTRFPAAAPAPLSASAAAHLVALDSGEVEVKLRRLFDCWGDMGLNPAGTNWSAVDALCVFVGRAAEEDDSTAERIQSWLTGFQFLETLFIFLRGNKTWVVLTSAKKAEHLRQLEAIEGLRLFVKDANGDNKGNLRLIADAMKEASGKTSEVGVCVAPFLGGSVAETPGTMASEVLPWLKSFGKKEENIEVPLSPLMAILTPSEVALVSDASRVSVAMVKYQLVSRIEFVLDNGQKESHKSICSRAEMLLKDQKQLQKLKDKCNLDPNEVEVLFKNVQSGSHFDLRASAQPSGEALSQTEGTIVVSLGCKYNDFCAALCRTFILNGRKEQKETYAVALELQQHIIASLKPGITFASVYEKAIQFLNAKKPALTKHLVKSVGHAIGAQYRDAKVFVESNMAFLVSVGFSDMQTAGGKAYAVWIADTVLLKQDGTTQVLTEGLSSQLAYVNYELDDGEEEPKAAASPAKGKGSKEEKRGKKGADENADGNAGEKKKGKEKARDKKEKDGEKSDKQSTGTISASVLRNAESLILRDRLRRRDNSTAAQMDAAEERDKRQRELRKKKLAVLQQRFAREDADDAGDEKQQRRQKKMHDLRAFSSPDEFPRDLRPNKLYVDMKSECLFVPVPGHHIPFHLSTVKNVTCSESESNLNAARVAAGGRPLRFSILRINFQVPGSQTLTQKGEENPLPDIAGKNQLFVKELMFKSEDSRHLQTIYRTIKEQLKRVKQKAAEDLQYPGELAAQEKLIPNRSGRRILLKDLMIRPNISAGMRKLIGALEAHTNGLRVVCALCCSFTVNTRGQMDVVDITYTNIKHAILQPCERELIVLVHFHLKAPILVGKKRTQDVQFYTEAGTQIDDLDNRRNRSYHDPDETLDEMREREMKKRLNSEFKRFVQQVEEVSKVEFDLPYRELKFSGVPLKSNVEILPTANCLIHLVEWPPFVLPLEDIEIVSFERVSHGLRNFDMIFDYNKPVKHIDLIPIDYLDNLKRWLNELEIVWYEGKQNLNWSAILKEIRDDPRGFVEDGGFDMFLGDGDESDQEGEESEDDDDEEYAEQSSSDDDKEYKEDGSDNDSSGQDRDSDSEYSSEDPSLADETDDEEAAETGSDEEEGLSWDELEERAKKEDRKRQNDGDSEGEETRTKKKRK